MGFRGHAGRPIPAAAAYLQADVILAMFLLSHEFSAEAKRRNFDFYDPLTTGNSSLSSCIEAIVALEVGEFDKAVTICAQRCFMDLGRRWRQCHRRMSYSVDGRSLDDIRLRVRRPARL